MFFMNYINKGCYTKCIQTTGLELPQQQHIALIGRAALLEEKLHK